MLVWVLVHAHVFGSHRVALVGIGPQQRVDSPWRLPLEVVERHLPCMEASQHMSCGELRSHASRELSLNEAT
jgi:hypothetical protein